MMSIGYWYGFFFSCSRPPKIRVTDPDTAENAGEHVEVVDTQQWSDLVLIPKSSMVHKMPPFQETGAS